jgi:integrase
MGVSESEEDMPRKVFNVTLEDGRKYTATGGTQNDALLNVGRHYAEMMGLTASGTASSSKEPECMTLKEFVETIYKRVSYPTLESSTIATYDEYLKRKILPFFGDKHLNEMKATDIQVWINELAEGGQYGLRPLNEDSIKRIVGLLKAILKYAITAGEMNDSPILRAKFIFRKAEKGGHYKRMSKKELEDVKRKALALPDERERLLITLFAYTGMRPEEVYGLKWENVYLEAEIPHIHVCQAVTYTGTNKKTNIGKPKTETSDRFIPLADDLLEVLKVNQQKEGYVIRPERGDDAGKEPVSRSTGKRIFESAMKHIGIKGYSAYCFRGSVAVDLREKGINDSYLQQLLGHRDLRMLETIYARPRQEGQLEARNILNAVMNIKTA